MSVTLSEVVLFNQAQLPEMEPSATATPSGGGMNSRSGWYTSPSTIPFPVPLKSICLMQCILQYYIRLQVGLIPWVEKKGRLIG